MSTRAPRSDAGQVRIKPRDMAALTWITDMRGISEPDLGWLLAQLDGQGEPLATATATSVVRRWVKAGWAQAHRVLVGQPRLITVTTKGAALVGATHVTADGRWAPITVPSWTQMAHVMACSRVRLAMQVELGEDLAEWVSDRALRAADSDRLTGRSSLGRRHLPDAEVVLTSGDRVAIEVELSGKAPARLDQIVTELSRSISYTAVRYYADPKVLGVVQGAIGRVRPGKNPVTLAPVPANPVDH